jgi:hypothetical protein
VPVINPEVAARNVLTSSGVNSKLGLVAIILFNLASKEA